MPEIASDPRNYFKFKAVKGVFTSPAIACGSAACFPDKFFIINNNYLGIGFLTARSLPKASMKSNALSTAFLSANSFLTSTKSWAR